MSKEKYEEFIEKTTEGFVILLKIADVEKIENIKKGLHEILADELLD